MISEFIIRQFSLPTHEVTKELEEHENDQPTGKELNLLRHEFPDFESYIRDKDVVDFGCGLGFQTMALAKGGARSVLGVDINEGYIDYAKERLFQNQDGDLNVEFVSRLAGHENAYDVVISQNAMEHYTDPVVALRAMRDLTKPNGCLLITFGPPWYAPYGSHMHFFCKIPWLNLLFTENAIMRARQRYRDDGASKFEEVESGLNKMTLTKFDRLVKGQNLEFYFKHYGCIKGIRTLGHIPMLKELFVNRVSAVLVKSEFNQRSSFSH